jgi:hypothetical protein
MNTAARCNPMFVAATILPFVDGPGVSVEAKRRRHCSSALWLQNGMKRS